MTDPVVRRRTAALLAAIAALIWMSVSLLGRPGGAFSDLELPDVAGLPIPVPQIEHRLPPAGPDVPGLGDPSAPEPAPAPQRSATP